MQIEFSYYHLYRILKMFENSHLPLDVFLNKYFKSHKQLGSKDRKKICNDIYPMIRLKILIDHYAEKPLSPESRHKAYQSLCLSSLDPTLAPHLQVSFPKEYFALLEKHYGKDKALEICKISNTQAPTTIRINPTLTSREKILKSWNHLLPIHVGKSSPYALSFPKRMNFFALPEFKNGYFEIQDEGSQLIAFLVQAGPKDHVLDYCSGSGGKTLAFAHQLKGKGQIYLHDIRTHALLEAKQRLKRAQVQNAQILYPEAKQKHLLKKMNWVIVDAPCSGSGTLRRNPGMKEHFSLKMLQDLIQKQQTIFEKALAFTKEKGFIVYATCSLFPEENENQVNHFLKKHPLVLKKMVSWLPENGGMDGFFGAVFQKI